MGYLSRDAGNDCAGTFILVRCTVAGVAGHLRGVGPGGGIAANAAAHELGHLLETLLHCPPLSSEGCAWESRGRINIISKQ